ncbi:uncharacterized protein LOC132751732 isoform X2 [Ruditapes philippinarum]|uniref:uncharacterized protein LOC132751732 isoform X2 n=1 Tax=Ruditapes philippinarum TaxID=129788 RepID=UPI00295A9E45|nr:uncharacterized protein LOC132751732 isoform X2 [Ruditapes philippinarum]
MSGILKGFVFFIAFTFFKVSGVDFTFSKQKVLLGSTVKPNVTSLLTRKNGFIVQGISPSDMATAEVGDEFELTCTANIGSFPETIIRWHRTSETSPTNEFIGYEPPQGTVDEGTAISDNQCGYTRVASIKYNATAADAKRDNNLAFECYVTVSGDPYGYSFTSENNPRFYTDVNNQSSGETNRTMSTTDGNDISIAAGAIAAIVIGSLIVSVLIGAVCIWVVLKRKRTVTGLKNQDQHKPTSVSRETELNRSSLPPNTYEQLQNRPDTENRMTYDLLDGISGLKNQDQHKPTSVSRETELNVSSLPPNTYEQLQNRPDTENRMTYDLLDASANPSAVPNSQSQYESLEREAGASQTYADLQLGR